MINSWLTRLQSTDLVIQHVIQEPKLSSATQAGHAAGLTVAFLLEFTSGNQIESANIDQYLSTSARFHGAAPAWLRLSNGKVSAPAPDHCQPQPQYTAWEQYQTLYAKVC